MVFTFGTAFSYGVFMTPFSDAFGVEPLALSTVFATMLFAFYIGAGVVGVFGARVPSRTILLVCAAISGLLAPSLYVVEGYAGLLVVFGALGLALGTVFVVLASIVPRWFDANRGTATGLIFAGNGLGLFVLPPAWQYAIDASGVRNGFFVVLSITAVAFLVAGVTCRRPDWAERSTASAGEILEWVRGLAGTRTFRLLFVGVGLSFAWYQLLTAYAIDLFTARGMTAAGASLAFGFVGGFSIISRLASGFVADTVGYRRTFIASLGSAAIGGALLVPSHSISTALSVFCLGIGLGGSATLYIPVLMRTYSRTKDTAVIGIFNVAIGTFSLVAPPVGTAIVDSTGSYTAVILLTVFALLGAIWAIAVGS
ncbi:Predicted arabinose efflux permease, MFS family [Halostagnicola kamekurae]|uniref:Predicted arabinose efflux permease, MFS family n=2 Tax=Halostagnicola kamekurae TaxID=619731 RepID=A0A1I6RLD1_9EURY|nr:Predicted arabinose efflux permease, MFS family [Halostagnicola kamekurae]